MSILTDGYPTRVTFSSADSGEELYFKEKEVTPPGIDVGEMNDVTNMRNETWRTAQFKKLKTLLEAGMQCHYDPRFLDGILSMIGENQQVRITMPDNSFWLFWGGIRSFVPSAHKEGEPPTAQVAIGVTNHDGAAGALGTERRPEYHVS